MATFLALQCYQCKTVQAKQQKKSSNKWTCVICNEKQSLQKIFARSAAAKDIRKFVQNFNMSAHLKNTQEMQIALQNMQHQQEINIDIDYPEDEEEQNQLFPIQRNPSKWAEYLESEQENILPIRGYCDVGDNDDVAFVTAIPDPPAGKRKRQVIHVSKEQNPSDSAKFGKTLESGGSCKVGRAMKNSGSSKFGKIFENSGPSKLGKTLENGGYSKFGKTFENSCSAMFERALENKGSAKFGKTVENRGSSKFGTTLENSGSSKFGKILENSGFSKFGKTLENSGSSKSGKTLENYGFVMANHERTQSWSPAYGEEREFGSTISPLRKGKGSPGHEEGGERVAMQEFVKQEKKVSKWASYLGDEEVAENGSKSSRFGGGLSNGFSALEEGICQIECQGHAIDEEVHPDFL